ncbi:MAG: hypothetical protein ACM3P0_05610 [Acidobacteriota bacterium]
MKIVRAILDLEKNYGLLEWKIDGVFAWQAARVSIYLKIQELMGLQPNFARSPKLLNRIGVLFHRGILNSILLNPFLDISKHEVLVFESGRKYLVNGKYYDIYTKYLCDELKSKNIKFRRYESNYLYDNLGDERKGARHNDFIAIVSKILSKFVKVSIGSSDIEEIKKIESEIKLKLNVSFDLLNLLHSEIRKFKSEYPLYKTLFRFKKAKQVYIVNSGNKAPLIKAAKENKMTVTELQHGIMVKEDLIDHFPDTPEDSLEYFPDKMEIWKELNANTSKLPLSESNIILSENRHLKYIKGRYNDIPRNSKKILIVSQPVLSKQLLQFVLKNIQEMKDYQFVFKLHPTEESYFFETEDKDGLLKYSNLHIVDNSSSIYKLLAESKYVIGIFSTSLFEAPYFGCKVFLLNLPGVEMASSLIESGNAKMLDIDSKLSVAVS